MENCAAPASICQFDLLDFMIPNGFIMSNLMFDATSIVNLEVLMGKSTCFIEPSQGLMGNSHALRMFPRASRVDELRPWHLRFSAT